MRLPVVVVGNPKDLRLVALLKLPSTLNSRLLMLLMGRDPSRLLELNRFKLSKR